MQEGPSEDRDGLGSLETTVASALHAIYRSPLEPRLFVLDKEAAGCKADAINAGINAATSPYICVVDADSILEKESLIRIMAGVFADPGRVVAGGIVRVLNGSRVVNNQIEEVRLPKSAIEVMHVIEYLRAFLVGREAWAGFNMLPIISGAFGVFQRDLVMQVGGFRTHAVGEDFDLVIRMHRRLHEQNRSYHIDFIPDPTCWTEAPSDLASLARQRARWHKGLIDALWPARDMLFRPRYGRVGWIILPYMWIFELFAPIIEFVGYSTIVTAFVLGEPSKGFFLQFLLFGYAFATLISIGSVLLEEMTFRRYSDWREVSRLIFYCLLRTFPLPTADDDMAAARHLAVSSWRDAMARSEAGGNIRQPHRVRHAQIEKSFAGGTVGETSSATQRCKRNENSERSESRSSASQRLTKPSVRILRDLKALRISDDPKTKAPQTPFRVAGRSFEQSRQTTAARQCPRREGSSDSVVGALSLGPVRGSNIRLLLNGLSLAQ